MGLVEQFAACFCSTFAPFSVSPVRRARPRRTRKGVWLPGLWVAPTASDLIEEEWPPADCGRGLRKGRRRRRGGGKTSSRGRGRSTMRGGAKRNGCGKLGEGQTTRMSFCCSSSGLESPSGSSTLGSPGLRPRPIPAWRRTGQCPGSPPLSSRLALPPAGGLETKGGGFEDGGDGLEVVAVRATVRKKLEQGGYSSRRKARMEEGRKDRREARARRLIQDKSFLLGPGFYLRLWDLARSLEGEEEAALDETIMGRARMGMRARYN